VGDKIMDLIAWNEEYSVGIESIDEQHKKLINIIRTLHDAIVDKNDLEALDEIVSELIDHTKYHFSYEEEVFEKYGYPDAENHKNEHAALTDRVVRLKADMNAGYIFIGMELVNFLQDWLVDHIMASDKNFGPFLIEKGAK
jgi:hemerythrin-like metal-binding protein